MSSQVASSTIKELTENLINGARTFAKQLQEKELKFERTAKKREAKIKKEADALAAERKEYEDIRGQVHEALKLRKVRMAHCVFLPS